MIKIGRHKKDVPTLLTYPGFGCQSGSDLRLYLTGVVWHEPVIFTMRQRMMIRMLGGVMNATPDDLKCETFQSRITPFMAEGNHRQTIIVEINGRSYRLRKKTKRNGHFRAVFNLPKSEIENAIQEDSFGNRFVEFTATADHPKSEAVPGVIYLLNKTGVSVVSDIDDTIKDSDVGDRRELLANTFLRDFRSVEGMADLYRQWSGLGANFHYVSSSPWQLFESLLEMNQSNDFPAGTMHLRNFRLRDQLLKKVILRRQGKMTAIRFLLKNLPERQFILVGDSGEKDPEIYAKIARKHPGRIKGLMIREVAHRRLDEDRFVKIQVSVPDGIVGKFHTADQLRALADGLFPASVSV